MKAKKGPVLWSMEDKKRKRERRNSSSAADVSLLPPRFRFRLSGQTVAASRTFSPVSLRQRPLPCGPPKVTFFPFFHFQPESNETEEEEKQQEEPLAERASISQLAASAPPSPLETLKEESPRSPGELMRLPMQTGLVIVVCFFFDRRDHVPAQRGLRSVRGHPQRR